MQAFRVRTILFAAASFLLASPAIADGLNPAQFDLVCQGTRHSQTRIEGSPSSPFALRLQVDLHLKAFCMDSFCALFTRTDPSHLIYHCQAVDGGRFCGQEGVSTAGPFPERQDFSIDRANGSFQRTVSGVEGDVAAFPFNESYSGTCAAAPFTNFSKLQQSLLSDIVHAASR